MLINRKLESCSLHSWARKAQRFLYGLPWEKSFPTSSVTAIHFQLFLISPLKFSIIFILPDLFAQALHKRESIHRKERKKSNFFSHPLARAPSWFLSCTASVSTWEKPNAEKSYGYMRGRRWITRHWSTENYSRLPGERSV